MATSRKIMLISLGGVVVLLSLIAVAVIYLVNADAYKPSLQTAASEALGMEVTIKGRVGISLFPDVALSMNDVHLRNHGKELMVVEKLRLGLETLALLQQRVQITNISLIHPKITIERGVDGRYNFDGPQTAATPPPDVSLAQLTVSGGVLQYADRQSGWVLAAADCSLNLRNLVLAGAGADRVKNLSFAAKLHCGKIGTEGYAASDLTLSVKANKGIFVAKPITLKFLGGDGSASMQADYSGKNPRYHLRFSLPRFRIEQLVKTQSQEAVVAGPMALSMDLSLQCFYFQQLKQSVSGEVALRGKDLELKGYDLDKEFSRFESSQNFSLLDMGALFSAGPVGMAVTKGYDFANVLTGSGGVSAIHTFVSSWRVKRGVMHAQDVAMATKEHRMALLGDLDIARERFSDVTLALINHKGCAEVKQKISGPFAKPVVEQP
ncbi:MAG: AsmA family protein, partial [Gammaproteobacteria bacterium]